MLNIFLSYFGNAKITQGTEKTINEIVLLIKNQIFEDKIAIIRKEKDKTKRNNLKANLPAVTASGLFKNGRKQQNCEKHSGLLQVDFDNLQDINEVKKWLKTDKHTFVMFVSPSGTGLKLFVKIPPNIQEHKRSFEEVENYYKNVYDLQIDKSTKDISRLCYLSSDKNLFLNENAEAFELSELPKENTLLSSQKENNVISAPTPTQNQATTTQEKPIHKVDFSQQDKKAEVERIIVSLNHDITKIYDDWLKIGFAFANEFGENGRDYFYKVSAFYPHYDHKEADLQYTNCLLKNDGSVKINTFFEIAKQNNVDISLPKTQKTHEKQVKTQEELTEIEEKTQKLKNRYVRVGTQYFMIENYETISAWTKDTIFDDFRKFFNYDKNQIIDLIPKYTKFCLLPQNINYQRNIAGKFNLYHKLNHNPQAGDTSTIHHFLRHIFGELYEFGLDYLTILYRFPHRKLPILCLVSEDRNTGKTTFLDFLDIIFQYNSVQLNFSDFEGDFNGHYITKLLICLDEGSMPKKEIEKLKQLSTSKKQQFKEKFIPNAQIDFFGKFILCSNEKNDFIKIDRKENRFCVIEVPKLNKENNKLLEQMKQQKDAFVSELLTHEIKYEDKTRFWFDYETYETNQTKNIKEDSREEIDKIMQMYVQEICNLADITEFYKTQSQIYEDFIHCYHHKKISVTDIEKYLKNEKKIFPFQKSQRKEVYLLNNLRNQEIFINEKTGEETKSMPIKTGKLGGKFYHLKLSDFA